MDHSGFDIEADLPQRGSRSQGVRAKKFLLTRVIDRTLPERLLNRARRAIARLGRERLHQSYFTTFWLESGAGPANVLEEAGLAPAPRPKGRCAGGGWWHGRPDTPPPPIE